MSTTRLVVSCLAMAAWVIAGCVGCSGVPVPRPFAIEELLIDQSLLPQGWEQQGPPSSRNAPVRLGVERSGVSFISYGGVANQHVYRCNSVRAAAREYPGEADSWFSPREGWGAWTVPAVLPYESAVADQFRFNCYTHQASGGQACQAVGRYDEYIVRFYTAMSDDYMTFTDLERILAAIDERMALYLEKDTP